MSEEVKIPQIGGINSPERLLISAEETAHLLGLSRSALYDSVASGRVPGPVKIGARSLWPLKMLREWTEAGCPAVEQWNQSKASA